VIEVLLCVLVRDLWILLFFYLLVSLCGRSVFRASKPDIYYLLSGQHICDSNSFGAGSSAPHTPGDRSRYPSPPVLALGARSHSRRSNPVHVICLVLCLHDFETSDPDQLSFSQNEILAVAKQEDSGWWAALRSDEPRVGWTPSSFVEELSEGESSSVRDDDEESRWSGGRPALAKFRPTSVQLLILSQDLYQSRRFVHSARQQKRECFSVIVLPPSEQSSDHKSSLCISSLHQILSHYTNPRPCKWQIAMMTESRIFTSFEFRGGPFLFHTCHGNVILGTGVATDKQARCHHAACEPQLRSPPKNQCQPRPRPENNF
jgi:hypothetical protein